VVIRIGVGRNFQAPLIQLWAPSSWRRKGWDLVPMISSARLTWRSGHERTKIRSSFLPTCCRPGASTPDAALEACLRAVYAKSTANGFICRREENGTCLARPLPSQPSGRAAGQWRYRSRNACWSLLLIAKRHARRFESAWEQGIRWRPRQASQTMRWAGWVMRIPTTVMKGLPGRKIEIFPAWSLNPFVRI